MEEGGRVGVPTRVVPPGASGEQAGDGVRRGVGRDGYGWWCLSHVFTLSAEVRYVCSSYP